MCNSFSEDAYEPRYEKTNILLLRKQSNREADQRLCFRYTDTTIPPLPKSEFSNLYPSSVAVQPGLFRIRSEIRTLVFSRRSSYFRYSQTIFIQKRHRVCTYHIVKLTICKVLNNVICRGFGEVILIDIHNN